MRTALAIALFTALGACGGTSPATDAATSGDSGGSVADGNTVDADPSCQAWRHVDVGFTDVWLMEAAPVHPERSARIMVSAKHCPGDTASIPTYAPTLENEYLAVAMSVWRTGPDCATPELVERPVTVRFPYQGSWTILNDGDPLVVDVTPAPAIACGATQSGCALDCDCTAGEKCLSGIGLGGPFTACAIPCEFDRDCLGNGACISIDDGLSSICEASADECADPQDPCPAGFDCTANTCEPDFVLNGASRHACSCDSECDSPLRCVFQFGADAGRCDVVCPTMSDGWCQGPHTCNTAVSVEANSAAVCAWVGD